MSRVRLIIFVILARKNAMLVLTLLQVEIHWQNGILIELVRVFKIRFNHNSTAISIVMLNLGSLEKQHNILRFLSPLLF